MTEKTDEGMEDTDVLIETAFHFWKMDMAGHVG
jgi:hypothetical protein